jgi:hypothetical protein
MGRASPYGGHEAAHDAQSRRHRILAERRSKVLLAVEGTTVRIFAYDRFKPGVTLETIEPYLPEEVANVWRLWKAGIVRENYARADEPGVVIVFELDSVEDAKRYTDDFPLTKAGFLEWFFIPLMIPLPIESLFRGEVDTSEPYDRTTTVAS